MDIGNDSLSFEKLTFEEALALLDETVESIESGELTLLESTRLYEKGMKLAQTKPNSMPLATRFSPELPSDWPKLWSRSLI